jgi:hypothetical protein
MGTPLWWSPPQPPAGSNVPRPATTAPVALGPLRRLVSVRGGLPPYCAVDVAVPEPLGDQLDAAVPIPAIGAERQVEQLGRLLLALGRVQIRAVQNSILSFGPRIQLDCLDRMKNELAQHLIRTIIGMLPQRVLNHARGDQWITQQRLRLVQGTKRLLHRCGELLVRQHGGEIRRRYRNLFAKLARCCELQPIRHTDSPPVVTEGDISGGADVVIGLGYVNEIKVVEEPLPVIEVGVAGIELPGGRSSQQDVDYVLIAALLQGGFTFARYR